MNNKQGLEVKMLKVSYEQLNDLVSQCYYDANLNQDFSQNKKKILSDFWDSIDCEDLSKDAEPEEEVKLDIEYAVYQLIDKTIPDLRSRNKQLNTGLIELTKEMEKLHKRISALESKENVERSQWGYWVCPKCLKAFKTIHANNDKRFCESCYPKEIVLDKCIIIKE